MKKFLSTLAIITLTAGAAFAACGKTETDKGTLQSYDAEKKQVTVQTAEGKTVTRTVTPTSKMMAKDGKAAEAAALKGKTVSVVSEHGKVQTISES
jgi:hypothetical protein